MRLDSLDSFFENLLGDIDKHSDNGYPFGLRVGCIKMASPRDERFDYVRDIGYQDIVNIFENKPFSNDILTFCFPERWLSMHEQQAFMSKILKHPNIKDVKAIDILTSSPLIIGNFRRESIRIIQWDNDAKYSGR